MNRENIEYTELSINNIIKKYIQVFDLISNNIIRHYEYIDNIAEYHHCIDNYDSSLGVILNFNNQSNNNNDNKNIILRVKHSDSYFKILLTRKFINYNEPFNTLEYLNIRKEQIERLLEIAYDDTKLETHQAMEGFLHNLNTMHSRGGNQVVFSSINYGTDTSEEGRMVIRELLRATEEGLGKKETPIFPIQIFKVKEGVNYSDEAYTFSLINSETSTLSGWSVII